VTPTLVLVTGATGKVGRTFIRRVLDDPALAHVCLRALCHNRVLEPGPRLEVVRGSLAERAVADAAMAGATHVVHLATCKETPADIMDVAVKGLFWLLEAGRTSPTFRRFVLIGGDAALGDNVYPRPEPVTERTPHQAYPGCYALSKVLEEVMLVQYFRQYDLDGCCLRAPWIMEKNDFRAAHSFGEDVFGEPRWCEVVGQDAAARHAADGAFPLLLDADGRPLLRSFVHVDDLVEAVVVALDHPAARQELFNVGLDAPVDYAALAAHLAATRGLPSVPVPTAWHSVWYDNAKAKLRLGWRPRYDARRLADTAWDHVRAADDPRVIWYPG
jgi:UDP-glucose 4-epimerase